MADDQDCEAILRRIDALSPEREEELCKLLNERQRERFMAAAVGISQKPSQIWRTFRERLESGNIDEDLKGLSRSTWNEIVNQMGSMVGKVSTSLTGDSTPESEDGLEKAFENFQETMLAVRQAVAKAIALEKLLERQLELSEENLASWQDRERVALAEGKGELAEQAKHKQLEGLEQVALLQENLNKQKNYVQQARLLLADYEQFASGIAVRMRVLSVRENAAHAMGKVAANLRTIDKESLLSAMAAREKRVWEKEEALTAPEFEMEGSVSGTNTGAQMSSEALLLRTVLALEKASLLLEKVEKVLGDGSQK